MKIVFCVVFVIITSVKCEDKEEIRKIERRGTYYNTHMPEEESRDSAYPNDFSIHRPPPPEPHYHHHHDHYHSYHTDNYHHHHSFGRPSVEENDELDYQSLNSTGIPLDFAKSLNEYIVSDLLLNYIEDAPEISQNQRPLLSSRFGEGNDANETERNSAKMARPAKCLPELTTVKIAESNDPNVFYVPECTRIERCGGCCSHVLLACQPVETETVTFSVLKTEYTGGKKLKYVGKEPVLVERHTKCKCGCKIKAEDCNSYQEYRESECRCICKNTDEEKKCYKSSLKKLWNPDICACQCRDVTPCSTNYQFDFNECRCVQSQVKRRYVLSDIRKEQPEPVPEESID